jgi:hypothetical protein
MVVDVPALHPVPDGPVAYRQRLRWLGPLLALVVPFVALVLAALIAEGVECTGRSCAVKGATVFSLTLGGLPSALLLGIPFEGGSVRYLLAVSTSTAIWLVVGAVAGQRATRAAVATWRDWWREYLLLAGALWLGVLAALALIALVLGGGFV